MGGSKGGGSRPVTAEEQALWNQQTKSLQLADKVAQEQWGLSQKDRSYFSQIFRGEANPNDPDVRKRIANAISKAKTAVPEMSKEKFLEGEMAKGAISKDKDGNWVNPDGGMYDSNAGYTAYQETYKNNIDSVKTQILDGLQDVSKSVDTILFDAVKSSRDELGAALAAYADKASAIGTQYGAERTGIADKYTSKLNELAGTFNDKMQYATKDFIEKSEGAFGRFDKTTSRYQSAYEDIARRTSENMGKADEDVLAQQRGQSLAGISQAYQEAQNQLLATMSRRGLAGTGVEAGGVSSLLSSEAQAKAGALSQSYNQAINMSDQRRLQQYGIAGDVYNTGVNIAGQQMQGALGVAQGALGARANEAQASYGVGSQVAQSAYNARMTNVAAAESSALNQAAMQYQGATGNVQQYLANLGMASGVASGIYTGASNMLGGAGQTANQSAQIAGQSAGQIGQLNNQYQQMQMENSGGMIGAIVGMAGKAGAAYLGNTSVFAPKIVG